MVKVVPKLKMVPPVKVVPKSLALVSMVEPARQLELAECMAQEAQMPSEDSARQEPSEDSVEQVPLEDQKD